MKKTILMTGCLMMMVLIHSCSKSVNPSPDPVLPPVDSTDLPDDGSGGDDGGDEGEDMNPITHTYSFIRLPILDASTRNSLYLGAVMSKTDNENLIRPTFIKIDDTLRNPITIYTEVTLDVDAMEDVKASKSTYNTFLSSMKKEFEKGVGQFPSTYSSGVAPFEYRFNSLRSTMGINEDMNELFDLGFADTTMLAVDKGRVILGFEVIKAVMLLQLPITGPYLSIDSKDKEWLDLFGAENTPEILSSVTYGETAYLVIESDSSTEQLVSVVKNCFKSPEDIISGAVFNRLSEQEQQILANATAYGFSIGNGSFPHDGKAAITHYEKLAERAGDTHDIGTPIYYELSNIESFETFETFKNEFDVDVYTQKGRD